jgi:hypothetical protein
LTGCQLNQVLQNSVDFRGQPCTIIATIHSLHE